MYVSMAKAASRNLRRAYMRTQTHVDITHGAPTMFAAANCTSRRGLRWVRGSFPAAQASASVLLMPTPSS